jgi:O-antigen/teichoic acid export membrane protein
MTAYPLSAGASTAVLSGAMLVREQRRFKRSAVLRLVRFGAPLVAAGMATFFLNAGDRYLLKWLADARTVGLYEWAARFAGVLNMLVVQSFNLAFTVIGLRTLGTDPENRRVHLRTFRHMVILTGWAALGLSLGIYDVTRFLPADPYYLNADPLVILLALGFVAYGVYFIIINVVYASGNTGAVSINVGLAALLNAALNVLLIPILGAMGAALTTLLSYTVLAFGAAYIARRQSPVRFPWSTFVIVLVLVTALYALGMPSTAWSFPMRFVARTLLFIAYPALVLLFRLYTTDEIRAGARMARAWISGGTGTSD